MLPGREGFTVVGEAEDGVEAVTIAQQTLSDIILIALFSQKLPKLVWTDRGRERYNQVYRVSIVNQRRQALNVNRIFIISGHLLFSYGLESLLCEETNLEIIGQEKDMEQAIDQIKRLQPDVVVLDSDNALSQITPILHASPGVKVISLSLQNNDLYVYQAKQWVARETEDLLEAIKADLHNIKPPARKENIY